MAFNLDNLLKEEVKFETGIKGKKILLYGCNDVGKTKQMSKMPKPFLIMTEAGGSAVSCLKEACDTWGHFKEIVDDLTSSKNLEKRKEQIELLLLIQQKILYHNQKRLYVINLVFVIYQKFKEGKMVIKLQEKTLNNKLINSLLKVIV